MQENKPISSPEETNNLSATEASTSQKPVTNKKTVTWLLVFLVVLFLGTTGFFAYKYYEIRQQIDEQLTLLPSPAKVVITSPSPTPSSLPAVDLTANWQIYRGEGFELSYPRDWYLLEIPGPVTSFSNSETEEESSVVVSVFGKTDVNIDSLDSIKKYYEDEPEKFVVLGDITIDGKPGFEVEFLNKFQREAVIAGDYNEVPQNIFTVFVTYSEAQKNEAIDKYLKILSTFKFAN